MSFSEFKNIPEVQRLYDITYEERVFGSITPFPVSATFLEEFNFNLNNLDAFASEGARCEIIIFPVLREIYKLFSDDFALWVQKSLSADEKLTGTPDYVLSKKSSYGKLFLEHPVLAVVEAKKNDFEQGWGQCLAELIASQKINKNREKPIYGIVTDGKLWEFAYLTESKLTKFKESYTIDNLQILCGVIHQIFTQCKESL